MSDLNKALLETIQQNLSGQVAGELTNVLEQWENWKGKVPKLEQKIKGLQDVNAEFVKDLFKAEEELKTLQSRQVEVEQWALTLEEKERSLDMRIMSKELEMLRSSKNDMLTLVDKVFSVPTVTVTTDKCKNGQVIPTDHYIDCSNATSETETTTTKESK